MKLKRKRGMKKVRWEFPITPKGPVDDIRWLWFYRARYEWRKKDNGGEWVFLEWV